MHTYLVKVYKPDDSLSDSYTLEAENKEQAEHQAKAKLSDQHNETYRIETTNLSVLSSAGATKDADGSESAPVDEKLQDQQEHPDKSDTGNVEPIQHEEHERMQMDASDSFEDQAELLTDQNIDPPIEHPGEIKPLSDKKQQQANSVKQELTEAKHK